MDSAKQGEHGSLTESDGCNPLVTSFEPSSVRRSAAANGAPAP